MLRWLTIGVCAAGLGVVCHAQKPAQQPAQPTPQAPSAAAPVAEPASSPAEQEVSKAREALKQVDAQGKGKTLELAKALNDLIAAEEDLDEPAPDLQELAKRELAVAEAAAGKSSKPYVDALSDNAETRVHMNRVAEARPFAEEAVDLAKKEFPDSQQRIDAAETLAYVCSRLSDMLCAKQAYEDNIAVERRLGPDRAWDLAFSLSNYSDALRRLPDEEAAAGAAIQEAFDLARRTKPDDIHIGLFENNLAMHFVRIQDFPKAIEHFNAAIPRLVKDYGPDNTSVRAATGNLASVYSRMGKFDLAWKTYESALNNPGETFDLQADAHADFARSLASGGNLQRSITEGLLANRMGRESFSLQARTLPERQALGYERRRAHSLDTALSVLVKHPDLPSTPIYEEMVRSRALVADEMARRQRNLNAANDPETARLLDDLNGARADLLSVEQKPQGRAETNPAVTEARIRMEKIERQLAERSAAAREDEVALSAGIDDLRRSLPEHSALVSYWAFTRRAVEKVDPGHADTPSYLAFVLRADIPGAHVIDLGPAKPIDAAVGKMRTSADSQAHAGGLGSTRNERAYREAGKQLRGLVWDPLSAALGDAQRVVIVPDGVLNLVSFASLPDGNGYLVERARVIESISSERDLLSSSQQPVHRSGLLAIGSPKFDVAGETAQARLRDGSVPCDALAKVQFGALNGAALELRDIDATWQKLNPREPSTVIAGGNATRDRFLETAPHSRVLHVATHAFVLDHTCGDGNPLLHSGLVFAGANRDRSASILTAQQIASLDLSGVEWAVLSACDTGGGELNDGEGVLGLERAFRIAGVRTVVMTLWPVDDAITAHFMHLLYTQRLVHHSTVATAVWQSSRKLLEQRRAAGESTHPWYWAGFVGSGWEPSVSTLQTAALDRK
ncbi:MAG TPA: CHAT domain-containing protein [Terracidiphilus sp.]|jgi:CHAT domain-containing protein/tetratricopeptide (TPR) repeat protein